MQTSEADGSASSRTGSASWLASTLHASDSRALERYLGTIGDKLRRGRLEDALSMSAALPRICSALEHPQLRTSTAHCVCWCDAWVAADSGERNVFPLTRIYLREEGEDTRQWVSEDSEFSRSVSKALLRAARAWYSRRGAYDITVQHNLGKLHTN